MGTHLPPGCYMILLNKPTMHDSLHAVAEVIEGELALPLRVDLLNQTRNVL